MEQFNKEDVYEIIKKYEKDYKGVTEDFDDIYSIYKENISFEKYSNYSEGEQESFITQIIEQYSKSRNVNYVNDFFERDREEITSLNTYYNFVGEEEVHKIQRAIIDNKVSKDILRGIKVQTNERQTIPKDTGETVVVEFSSYNGSPVLVFMEIYDKNNKLVYSYGRGEKYEDLPDEAYEDEYAPKYYKPTTFEKQKYKGIVSSISFRNDEIIERITKKGVRQFIYRNTGKFVEKEVREMLK